MKLFLLTIIFFCAGQAFAIKPLEVQYADGSQLKVGLELRQGLHIVVVEGRGLNQELKAFYRDAMRFSSHNNFVQAQEGTRVELDASAVMYENTGDDYRVSRGYTTYGSSVVQGADYYYLGIVDKKINQLHQALVLRNRCMSLFY